MGTAFAQNKLYTSRIYLPNGYYVDHTEVVPTGFYTGEKNYLKGCTIPFNDDINVVLAPPCKAKIDNRPFDK